MPFCIENKLNWLYIDINSYFATIEQQVNPDLRNKPVAIVPLLSDSTCAIAASQEAKLKGITTGTRIYQAKKLCPELICIKARHNLYVEYHHKIFNEVDRYLHIDHIFSIDEGACRLTGKYCLEEEAVSIAKIIKKAIRDNVGDYITSSIGIAPNRYLAKIASNMQKPDGLSVINPSELPNKLYSLNLKSLPGIGSKTEQRLIKNGITSIKQLCFLDRARLKALWGNVWGEKVWSLIRGADLPLEETRNSTIGHSKVLGSEQQHIQHARNVLINLVQKAASRLRAKELYTTCILLTVGLKSGNSIKESLKIELSSDSSTILKHIIKLWDKIFTNLDIKQIRIKKVGISFYNLQTGSKQLTFEDFSKQKKNQKLSEVLDAINKRMGINSVSIGVATKTYVSEQIVAFGHIPEIKN
jgi:DNA polymerase IV